MFLFGDDGPAAAMSDETLVVVVEVVMVGFAEQGEVVDVGFAALSDPGFAAGVDDMMDFAAVIRAVTARVDALTVTDDHRETLHR